MEACIVTKRVADALPLDIDKIDGLFILSLRQPALDDSVQSPLFLEPRIAIMQRNKCGKFECFRSKATP